MNLILRYIAVAFILIAGYFAMTYMQARFDQADMKKAIAAVQAIRPYPASSETITDALAAKYSVKPETIYWSTEIQSKWRGTVRVTALIPNTKDSLTWLVDVSAQEVMPESSAAKSLFEPLEGGS